MISSSKKMICIAGKNQIAIDALSFLLKDKGISKNEICVIPNKNDAGVDGWQPSLKKFALQNSVPLVDIQYLYTLEDLVFFSLEFDRIIRPYKFASNKLYNIHFSLLPKYKGMYTSAWPILRGERISGVTLHEIDEGIDTGRIIAQRKFEIPLEYTSRDLYFKYMEEGFSLFVEYFDAVVSNSYESIEQPFEDSTYFDRFSIDYSNIQINLKKTSFEIYNQIRAFIFPEFQLPKIDGMEILSINFTNKKIKPNTFIVNNDSITISGIDGYELIAQIKGKSDVF